ncbi:MAG TPA: Na+/H+ antiporter [Desulfosporosinus sp.]
MIEVIHPFAFIWLLLLASVVAMLGRFIKIPYTIALVLTGLFVGYLKLLPGVHLEPHTLFAIFLPPLLFEAGINIHLEPLKKNWKVIVILAVFGTLFSTFVVGFVLHILIGLQLLVALLFGAIISPTDPISVLSIFKRLGINERLSVIVEAESLFNDGIAVILFSVIQSVILSSYFSLAQSELAFIQTVFGGALVGIIIGAVASRVTREYDDHLLEITLTTIVAFGSYMAAEGLHVSGVIAVVAASLVVGNYGMTRGMTSVSRLAVLSFWEYAAFVANSMVFLLVGLEMTNISMANRLTSVVIAVIAVLLGRAVSTYGLSALLNRFGLSMPWAFQHVLVWSGLRGALSMAMVLGIDASMPERSILIPLTFGVVLFSLVGQGLTIEPLINKLGLNTTNEEIRAYQNLLGESMALRSALAEIDRHVQQGNVSQTARDFAVKTLLEKQQEVDNKIKELHLTNEVIVAAEREKAGKIVLTAQRNALQEATRNGVMDGTEVAKIIGLMEIDLE